MSWTREGMTKKQDATFVAGMTVLMIGTWLGFLMHRSPRFPGSPLGASLGILGGLLILVPLLYLVVKRVRALKRLATRRVSMGTLLTVHIYAGIVGPILAIVHSGHKFDSILGVSLTSAVLIVAVSGFVGRYLNSHVTRGLRDKKTMRDTLQERVTAVLSTGRPEGPDGERLLRRSAGALADVEYAVKTHERFKVWFARWLSLHIVISFVLYGLLALHVWAALHFTARWYGMGAG